MLASTKCLRERLVRVVAFFVIALTGSAIAQQPPNHADVVFGTTPQRNLTLDLYLPKQTETAPIVVYIHGDGWRGGNPKQVPFADLTKEGFAVASISYRFSGSIKEFVGRSKVV